MKIGCFVTLTDPERRGDLYSEILSCYTDLFDELVIIDGSSKEKVSDDSRFESVCQNYVWPQEFSWEFIGQQFQRGYELSTADWVFHCDADFIFHENDFKSIRAACERHNDAPALSFWKYQFILPDRYNLKSRLVIAVNKRKYGSRIRFDSGGDLCQPSLDGLELKPGSVPEAQVAFYNYEKILKTKEQITNDVGRMARAWQRYFGQYKLGGPEDSDAFNEWLRMAKGRFSKPQQHVSIDTHPKYMKHTISNLQEENFGHSGFGYLEENKYIK